MSQATTTPSISLYYQQSSSDKEYHAQITAVDDLFLVNFQYGRHGSSLASGSKTSRPVPFDQAEKLFTALIREKKAKGYTEGGYRGTLSRQQPERPRHRHAPPASESTR